MSKAQELIKLQQILGRHVPNFVIVNSIDDFNIKKRKLQKNKRYAIRSSASCEDGKYHRFAGMFNTYLNVKYVDIDARLIDGFDMSLCSNLQTYLNYFNLNETDIKLEVIIQEMIDCTVSGVCFSINPTTLNDEYVLEAIWGLGCGLVSGRYSSDQIIISKDGTFQYSVGFQPLKMVCTDSGIGESMVACIDQCMKKLNKKQIKELTLLMNILKSFQVEPFEIEWGYYKNTLYVFQIRPITTINK